MAAYIAPISWGLGDLVVSLPAVQALIDAGQATYIVTRSHLQEGLAGRIPGLAGSVREPEFEPAALGAGDRYYNLRDHPLQTGYWWGSPQFECDYPGYTINDILSRICLDLGLQADFGTLKPLSHVPCRQAKDKVVFLPGTDGSYKSWPLGSWLELSERLSGQGVGCLMVGQPEASEAVRALISLALPWSPTPLLSDALDLISSAAGVVGVDTGLTHLAVHQGIPTVALYRHRPVYVRYYDHTANLQAKPCAEECTRSSLGQCYNHLTDFKSFKPQTWHCQLPEDLRCMTAIGVSDVISRLQRHLPARFSLLAGTSKNPRT